jgi:rubrerythrin
MKSVIQYLNECSTDIFSVMKNDRKLTESELIRAVRLLISDEYDAIRQYTQLAESIDNKEAISVLESIIKEEKVHAGEFLKLLKTLDPEEDKYYQQGAKEKT